MSHFNYCSITWLFCNETSYVKIEHKKKSFTHSLQWASHVFGRTTKSWTKHPCSLQAQKYLINCALKKVSGQSFYLRDCNGTPNPQPLTSYTCRSVKLNGWVFDYKQSGSGFESRWNHLNFIYCACFEQGVSWDSNNYGV